MEVKYINPFIESVDELFSTMLSCEARQGDVQVTRSMKIGGDIVALVGLTGSRRGTVALSFPSATACAVASRFIGMEITECDETVSDAMAEVANIVAGGAKSRLWQASQNEEPMSLSLPTIISGSDYTINYPAGAVWLQIPFSSELGDFQMRLIFVPGGNGSDK